LIDSIIFYIPIWLKLYYQACSAASVEVSNSVWPPLEVLADEMFWRTSILETCVVVLALIAAIIPLAMLLKSFLSNKILGAIGTQIIFILGVIVLGYRLVDNANLGFSSQIYGATFFVWLGDLGFYFLLALCLAVMSFLSISLSNNRLLHGVTLSANLIAITIASAGWGALVHAVVSCGL